MTTTIFNLPIDLLEQILFRIPSKSMREVRLTCKTWDSLSKSRSFSKMHFGKETALREGESQIIVMMDSDLYLKSFFVDGEPYTEPKGKLTCQDEQVKISQVFNCEGLLLCILKGDTKSKVVVWNPYWGQTRLIEPRHFRRGDYGCMDRFFDDRIPPSGTRFLWYELYDFDTDLWTTLDVPSHWSITFYQCGVSLKGNTYFCATKLNSGDELDGHLICFDFTRERFGPLLPFPFPFRATHDDYVTLSCVREEKLAVLFTHNEYDEVDIWITTKIEAEKVLWSKFLTLNTEPDYPLSTYGFFIYEEKKVAIGFDDGFDHHTLSIVGETGYLRKVVLGERVDKYSKKKHVCSYVPSLVQIKQHAGGKRKKQSSLEERRYDEKMLRLAELENPVKEQSA